MPPPERVDPDRREELLEREAEEEIRAASGRPPTPSERALRGFVDRREAGGYLASALGEVLSRDDDVVVLAIPRGGVEVGAVVAAALGAPLDVVIPRKVGAPGNPELGLGAVADEIEVLDEHLIRLLRVDEGYLREEIASQRDEIARRRAVYRAELPTPDLAG